MPEGIDILVRDRIAASINTKLIAIQKSAKNAAIALNRFKAALKTGGTGSAFTAATAGVTRFSSAVRSASASTLTFSRSLKSAAASSGVFTARIFSAGQAVRSFLSAFLLIGVLFTGLSRIDIFANMQNRIKIMTKSTVELNTVTQKLKELSDRSRQSFALSGDTFTDFDRSIKLLGGSSQDTFDVLEGMGNAMTLSGASTEAMSDAIEQMKQAMNSGTLRGQELNSVLKSLPQASVAIAKTMGISTNALRTFSKEGEITSEVLLKSFLQLKKDTQQIVADMDRTFTQAFQQLKNEITSGFGELDVRFGITKAINSFIDVLKNNLPAALRLAVAAIAGFATASFTSFAFATSAAIALSGGLALIPIAMGAIVIAVGALTAAFVFFSDEIETSNGGLTTLQDTLFGVAVAIRDITADLLGIGNATRNLSEIVQATFSAIGAFIGSIVRSLGTVVAHIVTIAQSFSDLFSNFPVSGGNIGLLLFEQISVTMPSIINTMISGFNTIVTGIGKAFEVLAQKILDTMVAVIDNILAAFKGKANFFTAPIIDALTSIRTGLKAVPINFGIDKLSTTIDSLKLKINELTPLMDSVGENFTKNLEANLLEVERLIQRILNGIDGLSQRGKQLRTEADKRAAALKVTDPNSLRGRGPGIGDGAASGLTPDGINRLASAFAAYGNIAGAANAQINTGMKETAIGIDALTSQFSNAQAASDPFFASMQQGFANLAGQSAQAQEQIGEGFGDIFKSGIEALTGEGDTKEKLLKFLGGLFVGVAKIVGGLQKQQLARGFGAAAARTPQPGEGDQGLPLEGLAQAANLANPALESVNQHLLQTSQQLLNIQENSQTGLFSQQGAQSIQQASTAVGTLTSQLAQTTQPIASLKQGVDSINQAFTQIPQKATQTSTAITKVGTAMKKAVSSTKQLSQVSQSFQQISQAAQQAGQQIGQTISQGAQQAQQAIQQLADSAVANFQRITDAANQAAQASSQVGSGGGGGGGGLFGFKHGGYTGGGSRNDIAGTVHRKEFVVPAGPTKQYRPLLEAITSDSVAGGRRRSPTGGGSQVTVHNYGSSEVEVQQSNAELQIIIHEAIATQTPRIVSSQLKSANSRVRKSLAAHTDTRAKR